ncbi:MAG TPA: PepSY-like domain-containing protein [Chitinophagaceae bacterium]|nr:PepSY-like domain-containing protein [Chitinophagaceae bacterium]
MKAIVVISLLVVIFATSACAQKLKVPEAVSKAFTAKFPGATDIKWGKESAKEYEAEFKLNNSAVSANFGLDGSWKETETTIKAADLPTPVVNAIKAKYPAGVITLAEKVEKPDKTYYETVVQSNGKKKEVEISADGKIL